MREYLVAMYKTDGSTPVGQTLDYLIQVEDHQRGDDAAHKAMLEHPDKRALYWGLKSHSAADPAGLDAFLRGASPVV